MTTIKFDDFLENELAVYKKYTLDMYFLLDNPH